MTDTGTGLVAARGARGSDTGASGSDARATVFELAAELARRFISVAPEEIPEAINETLAAVGAHAGADRAFLVQCRPEVGAGGECTHEWCAPGVASARQRLRAAPGTGSAASRDDLDAGLVVRITDAADRPAQEPGTPPERRATDPRALLMVPVMRPEGRVGALGLAMIRRPRDWDADTELLLDLAARTLAEALRRQRMDASLMASQQRYRDLVENSAEAIVVLDGDTNRIVDTNDNTLRLFGVDRETLMTTEPEWVLPARQPDGQDSVAKARDIFRRCLAGERLAFDWLYRDASDRHIPCEVRAVPLPAEDGRRIRLSILDVSDRKDAENEQIEYLRRTREQHLQLGRIATGRALADGDLETLFGEVCRTAQGVLGVARVSVWMLTEHRDALHCRGLAEADDETPETCFDLPVADNPRYIEELGAGRAAAIEDVESDQRSHGMLVDYLRPRGIRAMLDAPVRVSGRVVGVLCAEHRGEPRRWRVDETGFLGGMADQVAQALINHERAAAAAALRDSEQRYRALYDDNPSMFFTVDEAGFTQSVNHFAADSLGYGVEELVGLPFDVLHTEENAPGVDGHLRTCSRSPGRVHRWDSRLRCRDGAVIDVRISARAQPDGAGGVPILAVCEDISEACKLAEELRYQARHDALTGLLNRREFEVRLEAALEEARLDGRRHVLCYLDLDQFKVINDTCGHLAGDELLRQLSAVLWEQLGEGDVLARLGGDEFGVLIEDRTADEALAVADRLRHTVSEFHFTWNGRGFGVGVSLGLVPIDGTAGSLHDIMSVADTACYAAKDKGRNRIHVVREGDPELARRHGEMQWVSGIRQALADDRFRLFYQPIVPLNGRGRSDYYELLLRMDAPDGTMIQPNVFLPAAERFNLIPLLDRWVLERALAWLESRPADLERLGMCAINLSGLSIGDQEFLEWLLKRLDDCAVPASKLCFEITETAAISNLGVATEFMHRLRGLGCRFALDDFGSGLSSFAYLKNLPVDAVKIDGVFVKDVHEDPINYAVVKSINEIGHVMGKETVAEFVESDAVRAALQRIGVDYGQGYGIASPQPIETMPRRRS